MSNFCAPSLIKLPQEAKGACTPKPKKLMMDSRRITDGTVKVAKTMMGLMRFLSMCFDRILWCGRPLTFAAST